MKSKPVKSRKIINDVIAWFDENKSQRDSLLFRFGINVGFRLSDTLPIRYSDIYGIDGEFREHLIVRERKTGKEISRVLNNRIRLYLDRYILDRPALRSENGYIFYSARLPDRPVHKSQVWKIFKKCEYFLALQGFSPQAMRKTFAWHLFKVTNDIRVVQKALNHYSPSVTMLYIGIDQVDVDKACKLLKLG